MLKLNRTQRMSGAAFGADASNDDIKAFAMKHGAVRTRVLAGTVYAYLWIQDVDAFRRACIAAGVISRAMHRRSRHQNTHAFTVSTS